MQTLRWGMVAIVGIAASAPAESAAELTIRSEFEPESRPMQLDLVVSTHYRRFIGFLPGVFFAFPVAPQGFISALNDAFYIEVGVLLGAYFDPTFFWFSPQAGVRWVFYLTEQWAVFGALRLGWGFEFDDRVKNYTFPYVAASVGAHWHFSEVVALRLETGGGSFGWHGMVGISFQL